MPAPDIPSPCVFVADKGRGGDAVRKDGAARGGYRCRPGLQEPSRTGSRRLVVCARRNSIERRLDKLKNARPVETSVDNTPRATLDSLTSPQLTSGSGIHQHDLITAFTPRKTGKNLLKNHRSWAGGMRKTERHSFAGKMLFSPLFFGLRPYSFYGYSVVRNRGEVRHGRNVS